MMRTRAQFSTPKLWVPCLVIAILAIQVTFAVLPKSNAKVFETAMFGVASFVLVVGGVTLGVFMYLDYRAENNRKEAHGGETP